MDRYFLVVSGDEHVERCFIRALNRVFNTSTVRADARDRKPCIYINIPAMTIFGTDTRMYVKWLTEYAARHHKKERLNVSVFTENGNKMGRF